MEYIWVMRWPVSWLDKASIPCFLQRFLYVLKCDGAPSCTKIQSSLLYTFLIAGSSCFEISFHSIVQWKLVSSKEWGCLSAFKNALLKFQIWRQMGQCFKQIDYDILNVLFDLKALNVEISPEITTNPSRTVEIINLWVFVQIPCVEDEL